MSELKRMLFTAVFVAVVIALMESVVLAIGVGTLLGPVEDQSPAIWGIASIGKAYIPQMGGIKVCKAENNLFISFRMTQSNIDYYKQEFSSGKRNPMGFEMDVIDRSHVFDNDNLVGNSTNIPYGVRYNDDYMDDSGYTHTLAINNPGALSADTWYVTTFHYSSHNDVANAIFEVQVQLVGNLFVLKNDFPEKYNEYSPVPLSELALWWAYFRNNPPLGDAFFNIRTPESAVFYGDKFFQDYDRFIWDYSASDNTKDFEPYGCGWGDYPLPSGEVAGVADENLSGSQVVSDPSRSTSKPELLIKKFYFGNSGLTHYYTDEDITLNAQVKNVGTSVISSANVTLKYYRFKGEKENGDRREVGSDNIKGSNLGSGKTKTENVKVGVPDDEDKYQYYACIDTSNKVPEANETNDCFKPLSIRVHKRPDLAITDLTLNGGYVKYEYGDSPYIEVTIENTGGEPFDDVPVHWYLDGAHYADDNMRHWNITHNDIKHEDVFLPGNLTIGAHVIKACAELDDDQDQSDNCRELSFEVTPALDQSLRADVNGDGAIISTDSLLVNRKALGLDMSQTAWVDTPITGDANCDGQPTSTDALLISRKAMGMSMVGTAWCLPE